MAIANQSKFPDVDFLPESEFRQVGTVAGTPLFLIGKEQGSDAAVVAKVESGDPETEQLFAIPLHELISHTHHQIEITEEI